MQGDTERRRSRKRKRKFGLYLYVIVVLLLTITNITLAALLLTHVQSIDVTGTENSHESEIVSWIEEDPLTVNSIYTLLKFKTGSYELPVFLNRVEVSLGAPWKVNVEVEEKQIIGCVIDELHYVYFDKDGLVLRKSSEYDEGIPVIEGMQVKNTEKYKVLKVDNEKVFSYIVELSNEIEKRELNPDRIVWEDNCMNLYFGTVRVKLGRTNFDEKVKQLPPILEELNGKSGTLDMEHYTSGSISFEKSE